MEELLRSNHSNHGTQYETTGHTLITDVFVRYLVKTSANFWIEFDYFLLPYYRRKRVLEKLECTAQKPCFHQDTPRTTSFIFFELVREQLAIHIYIFCDKQGVPCWFLTKNTSVRLTPNCVSILQIKGQTWDLPYFVKLINDW